MQHILIVEDDRALGRGVALALGQEGRLLRTVHTLAQAREELDRCAPDLVILDLNLPDGSGLELLALLRRRGRTPVLILTANDLESDQVAGLELGADDYVTKPFSLAVLRARVQRPAAAGQARRQPPARGTAPLLLRLSTHGLRPGRRPPWSCPRQSSGCCGCWWKTGGVPCTREQLLDRVWDGGEFVDENALSVAVRRLRAKLVDAPIKTVYGVGYTWEVDQMDRSRLASAWLSGWRWAWPLGMCQW